MERLGLNKSCTSKKTINVKLVLNCHYEKFLLIFKFLQHQNILQLIFKNYLLRNRKIFKELSNIPFIGVIKTRNGKDTFWRITNYKNGLANGLSQFFFR